MFYKALVTEILMRLSPNKAAYVLNYNVNVVSVNACRSPPFRRSSLNRGAIPIHRLREGYVTLASIQTIQTFNYPVRGLKKAVNRLFKLICIINQGRMA